MGTAHRDVSLPEAWRSSDYGISFRQTQRDNLRLS